MSKPESEFRNPKSEFLQTLKPFVPRPLRPPLRKLLVRLFPSVRYYFRLQNELQVFTATESVQDLPAIAHYWSNKYLVPMLQPFGFTDAIQFFRTYIARVCARNASRTVSILSVGCGTCATEINIAEWLRENAIENYSFDCADVNAEVLARAEMSVREKGLTGRFNLSTFDVNRWRPARQYDVILAVQSLHHFLELEVLFHKIKQSLHPDGYFLTDDMIGRNGHQRWPEALAFVEELWRELPDKYKYNHGLKRFEKDYDNWDCSQESFEGTPSQDVLPLLLRNFHFDFFFAFGNVIDIFVDRSFGPNFDPANEWDRSFIDRVHALDMSEIEAGRLKPTHMMAAMTVKPVERTLTCKHLSPQFCVRWPAQPHPEGVAGH